MGKSIRSKRMRANRIRKRIVNRPKELRKLKEAIAFEYNEQTENAHISIFNDIVNGPLPNDGTYFEPNVTVLEKTQYRYENFLARKIPKIAEIARRNLVRPIEDPKKEENDSNQRKKEKKLKAVEEIESDVNGCKPNKSGSWPKWMNQRSIKTAARSRRKRIQQIVKQERRINKAKKSAGKTKGKNSTPNKDVEMKDKGSISNQDVEMKDS